MSLPVLRGKDEITQLLSIIKLNRVVPEYQTQKITDVDAIVIGLKYSDSQVSTKIAWFHMFCFARLVWPKVRWHWQMFLPVCSVSFQHVTKSTVCVTNFRPISGWLSVVKWRSCLLPEMDESFCGCQQNTECMPEARCNREWIRWEWMCIHLSIETNDKGCLNRLWFSTSHKQEQLFLCGYAVGQLCQSRMDLCPL